MEQEKKTAIESDNNKGIFWYEQVHKLNFKRDDYSDSVHFDQRGWNPFFMELKLTEEISLNWDCETRTIDMTRCNEEGDILGRMNIKNYHHLTELIDFFTGKKKGKVDYLSEDQLFYPNRLKHLLIFLLM